MKSALSYSSFLIFSLNFFQLVNCQSVTEPIITAWINSTGKGYKNYYTNVVKIDYSSSYVYVATNSIPSFSIGPWQSNPNDAAGKNYTFKFPRYPTPKSGTKTTVPLGHIGLWKNGVSIYNADDGQTYNNKGVWKRNAYIFEGISFDACKGHPDGSSEYHQHISSGCLYSTNSSSHSPLIGFAFDGYPIYGPYGYSSALDSSSGIKRMITGWKVRSITDRTTLANGTVLSADLQGPSIASYALGSFLQDYEYSASGADLDQYNGRNCVTPDYPGGTYAYFIATDSSLNATYPFVIGPSYYGTIVPGNTGPNSGKITISESVTNFYTYSSSSSSSSSSSNSSTTNFNMNFNISYLILFISLIVCLL